MKLMFWASFLLVAYTYIGYVILLWLQVRLRRQPVLFKPISSTVTIVIAARNEEANLPPKIENLRITRYPPDKLQIVIASDASTDGTNEILRKNSPTIVPVFLNEPNGKASALNEAVKRATGDILVFQDTRQSVDANAVLELVSCFSDPAVGAASGELLLESASYGDASAALGIYWKIEKIVRRLESESGSVIGVTGALYAIRRELYHEMPAGTLLDDVFIPMHAARLGGRIVFQPAAIARDHLFTQKGKEFSRKVRTLTGNYQLLTLSPWLLSTANPLLFRFISHKLLRLTVPLFLPLILLSAGLSHGLFYSVAFWFQILFYIFAIVGAVNPSSKRVKPIAIANTFVMLNAAATVAFYNFVTGNTSVWNQKPVR